MQKRLLAVFFLLCSLLSSGMAQQTKTAKSKRDRLVVAVRAEPPTLDPHNSTALAAFAVQRVIFDTLVTQGVDGSILPSLAEKWEVLDDLTIRFYLRKDALFSNGEPVTAEDVRYSIKRSTEQRGSASLFSAFDGTGTAVVNALTVDVKLKYPFAPVYNYLASSRGGIICKKAFESMGEKVYARSPIGSGPFVLEKWITGDSLQLKANPKYWGSNPAYSALVFRVITEPANRAIELETGGVDAIYDVDPGDVDRLSANKKLKVISGPGYKFSYITMNNSMPPFDDIRVREALAISLNMNQIVNSVYKGAAKLADSLMAPTVFGYKKVGPYTYNPERAKMLLKEAGKSEGLKVTLMTNEDRNFLDVAEIAQNMWKKIGVQTDVQILEQATLLSKAADGSVGMGITSSTPTTGDPDHALMPWPSAYKSFLRVTDPKIDEYINVGKRTYDPAKRIKAYQEALEYMWTRYCMIPISFTNAVYATAAYVENFDCSPGNTPNLSMVTFK